MTLYLLNDNGLHFPMKTVHGAPPASFMSDSMKVSATPGWFKSTKDSLGRMPDDVRDPPKGSVTHFKSSLATNKLYYQ